MKDGYVVGGMAGLIAGLADGIFAIIISAIMATLGLWEGVILEELLSAAINHIGLTTIWAVILGILYVKFYDVIPGSGAKKGLVFGLIFFYLMADLWIGSYHIVKFGDFMSANAYAITGSANAIIWGPIIGVLYESSKQPMQTNDRIKHKAIAGPIAGLVGGIVAFMLNYITGVAIVPIISITNFATEIIFMVIWGIIFSIIFVLFYGGIPGKKIMKGFYYGLLLSLLCVGHGFSWWLPYGTPPEMIIRHAIPYVLAFISYGLLLGYLYKK